MAAEYCPSCGAPAGPDDRFCGSCGHNLNAVAQPLRVRLSSTRIAVMSTISAGMYLYYWFYLTWAQYRDHTKREAYPVWHSLTLFVPFYSFFRMHAHVRTYRELMLQAGLDSTLNPAAAVVALIAIRALGYASFSASTLTYLVLTLLLTAITAGLLLNIQQNLNDYWDGLPGSVALYARIGVGEVIITALGALTWISVFVLPNTGV